jgi:hypothetical protein
VVPAARQEDVPRADGEAPRGRRQTSTQDQVSRLGRDRGRARGRQTRAERLARGRDVRGRRERAVRARGGASSDGQEAPDPCAHGPRAPRAAGGGPVVSQRPKIEGARVRGGRALLRFFVGN